jgi:hypothetical protein
MVVNMPMPFVTPDDPTNAGGDLGLVEIRILSFSNQSSGDAPRGQIFPFQNLLCF